MLYTDISAIIQINGYFTSPIHIQKSVRQGCPASMVLFALALNPLLYKMDSIINGISLNGYRLSTLAYADDVSVILTKDTDIRNMCDILRNFGLISGLKINATKSQALLLGRWNTVPALPLLQIVENLKILGITYYSSLQKMQAANWDPLTQQIKFTAKELYNRDLCFYERIWAVHTYVLSQLWYKAQILVLPNNNARQITSVISWFIWHGNIFKVPLSTLERTFKNGGLGLFNIKYKCLALFLNRNLKLQEGGASFSTAWLHYWKSQLDLHIPLDLSQLPTYNVHLKTLLLELCYLDLLKMDFRIVCTKYIYNRLLNSLPHPEMRIARIIIPGVQLSQVWKNITSHFLPVDIRSVWYMVTHDILPTKERLHRIHMVDSDRCTACGQQDTIIHRLVYCSRVVPVWERLLIYLRRIESKFSDWFKHYHLIWPDFHISPPDRHVAVIWTIAHTVYFTVQYQEIISRETYIDYMCSEKLKFFHRKRRHDQYASAFNFL